MEVGIYLTDTTVSKSLLSAEFVFTLVEFNSAIAIFVVCNLVRLRFGDIHLNAANSVNQNLKHLKIGNDILFNEEKIRVDRITGHGGLFKTKGVGQRILAAAINSPISVMETAGEGGAWGIALLASYLANNGNDQSLADFLDKHVFTGNAGIEISPTAEDVSGFNTYIESYKAGLPIEEAAVRFKN